MFAKLRRFFRGEAPPVAGEMVHPVLGTLKWSEEDEAWITSPEHNGIGFALQIAGTPRPDESLVRHAAEIVATRDEFVRSVERFLSDQMSSVRNLGAFREELGRLKIERVCLFWSERPNDGMIFFEGGRDHRIWRCDYVGRNLQGLGFDS
jgi:hypothetical protein